jgi:uncharacterized protein
MRKRGMNFGVLAVITEDTIKLGAKKFFNFFIENSINNFSLLTQQPAVIAGQDNFVSRRRYSKFLNDIFDLWYELDDPQIKIRDFESIISAILGGKHRICQLGGGCMGKYFAIDTSGDVYHCDEFMFDPHYKIGNIHFDNIENMSSGNGIEVLRTENGKEIQQLDCKWLPICKGGCPKDRYVGKMFSEGKKIQCCGYADLIEHIFSRINEDPN